MSATGPITEAGKTASSRNAVRHGLLSEAPVVTCMETTEEWELHRAGVLADLAPHGQMEICLAERAALLIWRLRRMAQAEVHWIDDRHKDAPEKKRNRTYIPGYDAITCLTRYEAHLGRELARTMKSLRDLQSRPAPSPERQSPITNGSGLEDRTLNGSTPLSVANTPAFDYSSAPADFGAVEPTKVACAETSENCETNSPAGVSAPILFAPQPVPISDFSTGRLISGRENNENYKTNPM